MSTQTPAAERIAKLRAAMKAHNIDVYIVPTSDPHNNEYVADRWKGREWLSGFTGSAGTLVVTHTKAALWTDSRYFLQAEHELAGSGIALMRIGEADVPTENDWIKEEWGLQGEEITDEELELGKSALVERYLKFENKEDEPRIGLDLMSVSYDSYLNYCCSLWDFCVDIDLLEEIWNERPQLPEHPIYVHPEEWAGESMQHKVERLRSAMKKEHALHYLLNDISEIAWLLNLRGNDIAYNPLFLAYLVVGLSDLHLFISANHLNADMKSYLAKQGITLHPYESITTFVEATAKRHWGFTYAKTINARFEEWFSKGEQLGHWWEVDGDSPITTWRAHKNSAEIEGFRRAMRHDGAALVRFRRELDEKIADSSINHETEWSISQHLEAIRAEHPEYRGLSFATIAGFAANGAIVHYEATAENHAKLENRSFLLLDSGAHYVSGTTDITRTIPLGTLTDEEKKAYTLVLKGLIQLSMAHFPHGTTGLALDFAARQAMWREGYDFGHGTGHGVGSHLCVHEGPHQIRKDRRDATQVPFHAGMTVSNEPGIYVAGEFGVRLENVLVAQPAQKTDFGNFLHFETLTLCPFDTAPIVVEMLEPSERAWLNEYHATVRAALLPLLSEEADKNWLVQATEML